MEEIVDLVFGELGEGGCGHCCGGMDVGEESEAKEEERKGH